jgi:hypothetical protein
MLLRRIVPGLLVSAPCRTNRVWHRPAIWLSYAAKSGVARPWIGLERLGPRWLARP